MHPYRVILEELYCHPGFFVQPYHKDWNLQSLLDNERFKLSYSQFYHQGEERHSLTALKPQD